MKKTLFVAISILLVLFAFTACEGNPSGPDDGEALVTEAEAKTLATKYFNAIDFSKLIVEASAGSTGTELTVTDPASNGFTVEFKNYKGEALTANTEAKISAIESGSIKFTFSSPKSTVTANTYTVNYYNGGTKLGSSTHTYGTAKNLTTISTLGGAQSGYTFNGWTTGTNTLTRTYTDGQSVNN